jgi:hypothetical protein
MDAQRYREIDQGSSEPDLIELFHIARAIDIDPSELVKLFEEEFRLVQVQTTPQA